jgi:hypothetical protein
MTAVPAMCAQPDRPGTSSKAGAALSWLLLWPLWLLLPPAAVRAAAPAAAVAPAATVALPPAAALRAAGPYPEEAVKAVFLYRFAGYVQWPSAPRPAAAFTIAVLGGDEVAGQLRQLLPGHQIQGEPARVRIITRVTQLEDAQMLYIGPEYAGNVHALIAALGSRPVLVVTDEPGGLQEGSEMNFVLRGQHVRFEISVAAARRIGLKISSALLAVAERVKTGSVPAERPCAPGMSLGQAQSCLVWVAGP